MRHLYGSRIGWLVPLAAIGLAAAAASVQAQVSLTTIVELAQQKSPAVRLAQSDVQKAAAQLAESRDAFIPSLDIGSGLPAFPEVGFTGSLPTLWSATVQSLVFSMPQIRYVQGAHKALQAAQLSLKDEREQVAQDASTAYIELDTVGEELDAARQQEADAARLVAIEEQRTESGVDPDVTLLQAKLSAAQIRLHRLHLNSRARSLVNQLSELTGLPAGSIKTDHASIPEIPALQPDDSIRATPGIESAQVMAEAKEEVAKGDSEHRWMLPRVSFGLIYNRNTTLLNSINNYYTRPLPANNLSSGFSIQVPIFNASASAKSRESAAEALRARVEAEQAKRKNDLAIAALDSTLSELGAQAEIAQLKQQIASEKLKSVTVELDLGNGAGTGPNAPAQLSPAAEQQARIDERQLFEDALEAGFDLNKARLSLLRALGHMQDWLDELHAK